MWSSLISCINHTQVLSIGILTNMHPEFFCVCMCVGGSGVLALAIYNMCCIYSFRSYVIKIVITATVT